jgi:hypothetical protein
MEKGYESRDIITLALFLRKNICVSFRTELKKRTDAESRVRDGLKRKVRTKKRLEEEKER